MTNVDRRRKKPEARSQKPEARSQKMKAVGIILAPGFLISKERRTRVLPVDSQRRNTRMGALK